MRLPIGFIYSLHQQFGDIRLAKYFVFEDPIIWLSTFQVDRSSRSFVSYNLDNELCPQGFCWDGRDILHLNNIEHQVKTVAIACSVWEIVFLSLVT